jgi:hypothetical protein
VSPQAVLAFGTVCSAIFVANTVSLRSALGLRIVENLRSDDPELQRNAAQMLHGEGGAVPTSELEGLLGEGSSADIEARVQHVLTHRGKLRVAAERVPDVSVPPVPTIAPPAAQVERTVTTDVAADGHAAHAAANTVALVPSNGQPIPNGEAVTGVRRAAKKTTKPRAAAPKAASTAPATKKATPAAKRTSRTTK